MCRVVVEILVKEGMKEKIEKGFFDKSYYAHEFLEMETHSDQNQCLSLSQGKDHFPIVTGNRWGKGIVVLINGAWHANYKPVAPQFKNLDLDMLNTSISQDQANIVFNKFLNNIKDSKKFSWLIDDIKHSPFPHIIFINKVKWWFRNASQDGKFLEGHAFFHANVDEADHFPDFYYFINEILAPRLWDYNGDLTWTTTPRKGKRNAYKVYQEIISKTKAGDTSVSYFNGDSRKNTFLHKSAIEKMNKLPQRLLNKNVRGLFEDSEGEIGNDTLDFCELVSTGLLNTPQPGKRYLNIFDLARSSTFTTGITLEFSDPFLQVVDWERHQESKDSKNRSWWQLIEKRIRQRNERWRGRTVIDATGLGDVMDSMLCDINPIPIKLSTTLRNNIIDEGIGTLQQGLIGIPLTSIHHVLNDEYWSLRDEFIDFDRKALDKIIWDMVCALFLGIWVAKGKTNSNTNVNTTPLPARAKGVKRHAVASVR